MSAPDVNPNFDMTSYPEPGQLMDIADHPMMSMPEPGHSPPMQHSTKMAGTVINHPKHRGK